MRNGWSRYKQDQAIKDTFENQEYYDDTFLEIPTMYSKRDFADILEALDNKDFIEYSIQHKLEIFNEINMRICKMLEIPPAQITIGAYKNDLPYANIINDGCLTLYCNLKKEKVNPYIKEDLGFIYLAYILHELKHNQQYYIGSKYNEEFHETGKMMGEDAVLDIANKMDFVEGCYCAQCAQIDNFYIFNTAERDANFFAFKVLDSLANHYPKYKEKLERTMFSIGGDYICNYMSQKVNVLKSELKAIKYYQKNFEKDFVTSHGKKCSDWINNIDEKKLIEVRLKEKRQVEHFVNNYSHSLYNSTLKDAKYDKYRAYLNKLINEKDFYNFVQSTRLIKIITDERELAPMIVKQDYKVLNIIYNDEEMLTEDNFGKIEDAQILY